AGVAAVAVVPGAAREPTLLLGASFFFFILEFGFVMLTVILSHTGLGQLAWVRILGGNLVGAVVTLVVLWRHHPLRREMLKAEAEEAEEFGRQRSSDRHLRSRHLHAKCDAETGRAGAPRPAARGAKP